MLISKTTQNKLDKLNLNSNKPLLLYGPKYSYIDDITKLVASKVLEIKSEDLGKYPYIKIIESIDNKAIGIEDIRLLNTFLHLSVPNSKTISRIVIINNADKLTIEAQNSLLKILEEPPKDTFIILNAFNKNALLPTILSRISIIEITKPKKEETVNYLSEKYSLHEIESNYALSDGMPEYLELILSKSNNEINENVAIAKQIISSKIGGRIKLINDLSKDKVKLRKILDVIKQMSKIGSSSNNANQAKKWQGILINTLDSEEKLKSNSQTKLTLLNYFLSF